MQAMSAGELCSRAVVFAYPDMALNEAARLMREHHVGSLVVVEERDVGRVPIGMVTDRDITVAVIARDLDARTINVGEIMSANPVTVRESDSVFDALRVMRTGGVRRVPVVGTNGTLVGILALDDVLEAVAEELRDVASAISSERAHEQRARP